MVIATVAQQLDRKKVLFFNNVKVIGTGSFGVVYQARLLHSEDIAIKVAKLNPQFKVCTVYTVHLTVTLIWQIWL